MGHSEGRRSPILTRSVRAVTVLALILLASSACGTASYRGAAPARPSSSGARAPATPPATPAPAKPMPSSSSPAAPPVILAPGMSGQAVRQLQLRLAALRYYPGPADGQFGPDTLEAVWAFEAVQGLPPSDDVGPAMQRALLNPQSPPVLVPGGGGTRIEINLAREVLVLYKAGQVTLISHVSTGGGYYYCSPGGGCGYAITPVGNFTAETFMPGWITVPLGEMYNSVFFIDTAYAIHGDTDVPLQPVSHGCVRIPMDIAAFFHTLFPIPGTPVYIRD